MAHNHSHGCMKHMMGGAMQHSAGHGAAKAVATSAAATASHGIVGRLVRNPVVLIGSGIIAGYMIHKYRQQIIANKETES